MAARETPDDEIIALELLEFFKRDRRWVALEIHDGIVQETTAALMFLEAATRDLEAGRHESVADALGQSVELLRKSILECRALINGLRPPELEKLGLSGALDNLCQAMDGSSDPSFSFESDDLPPLGEDLETALYRIAQEGLTNAVKHSNAKIVELKLFADGNLLVLTVDDNGIGSAELKAAPLAGVGLRGIQERVEALGGQTEFGPSELGGSQLRVAIHPN
jgi:signal transduction histidine kinase